VFYDALQLMTMQRVSCGDVFFSGHSIIFTVGAAVWGTYSRNRFCRFGASLVAFIGMLSLIMSAYHYTIDVLFGHMVTMWVWGFYHWVVMLPSLRATWYGQIIMAVDRAPEDAGEFSSLRHADSVMNLSSSLQEFSIIDS
jgi:hypothetical protein